MGRIGVEIFYTGLFLLIFSFSIEAKGKKNQGVVVVPLLTYEVAQVRVK
jgi:hypothetical protein